MLLHVWNFESSKSLLSTIDSSNLTCYIAQYFSTGCIVHPRVYPNFSRVYHYNRVYWGVQHTIKQNSEFIFIPDVTVSLLIKTTMILTRLYWSNFTVKRASIHQWPQRQYKLIVGTVVHWHQSYKSGRAFWVEFRPQVDKIFGLILAWDHRRSQDFWLGGGGPKPHITCNDVIRNFEKGIFCGGKDIV